MRTPFQFRRGALITIAAFAVALAGPAHAQVIMGLPDDPPTQAETKPAATQTMRSAMAEIRKQVLDVHSLITHRRLAPDAAQRFAKAVTQQTAALSAESSSALPTEVLIPLSDAAKDIAAPASGNSHLDALEKIETALARYPQLIDDPDWKPLR